MDAFSRLSPRRKRLAACAAGVLALLLVGGAALWSLLGPHFRPGQTAYLYVDRDDTPDSVLHKLGRMDSTLSLRTLSLLMKTRGYRVRTGRRLGELPPDLPPDLLAREGPPFAQSPVAQAFRKVHDYEVSGACALGRRGRAGASTRRCLP